LPVAEKQTGKIGIIRGDIEKIVEFPVERGYFPRNTPAIE